jgi:hypothetical protein
MRLVYEGFVDAIEAETLAAPDGRQATLEGFA